MANTFYILQKADGCQIIVNGLEYNYPFNVLSVEVKNEIFIEIKNHSKLEHTINYDKDTIKGVLSLNINDCASVIREIVNSSYATVEKQDEIISIINSLNSGFDSVRYSNTGELRVVEPTTLFSAKVFNFTDATNLTEEYLKVGSVNPISNKSLLQIRCNGTTIQSFAQSKPYIPYQAGKTVEVKMTFIPCYEPEQAGYFYCFGQFDSETNKTVDTLGDGLYLMYSTVEGYEGWYVCVRSSTSGTEITKCIHQNNSSKSFTYTTATNTITQFNWGTWNGVDVLDGNGSSGITLDPTKTQLLLIKYLWQGVSHIEYYMEANGELFLIHTIKNNANELNMPFMRTATLPIRAELFYQIDTENAPATSSALICVDVVSEGGQQFKGRTRVATLSGTKTVGATYVPIMSIRLKDTHNRFTINPISVSLALTSNNALEYEVIFNATLTGDSFADIDTYGACQQDTSATAYSNGKKLLEGNMTQQVRQNLTTFYNPQYIGANIEGTPDTLTIIAKNLSGGNATIASCIFEFQEIY